MSKDKDLLVLDGRIVEVLPNQMFKVNLNDNEQIITAYTNGKMRQKKIRLVNGDKVRVEISPYDLQKGRIVYRL